MSTLQNGAKLFVDCLVQYGVKRIFGIPGAKIDALFDALIDSPIEVITCRHEQNAAFMAAAYGRLTGKPGVVLVTSGPGVSNLATGLLTATTEGDPIIAIGGNVPRHMKLKESHQSTDNIKLMEAVTKARMEVLAAENIPEILANAFRIATMPRSGAVFISVPQDILTETTSAFAYASSTILSYGTASTEMIEAAAALLNQSQQPVLLLGLEASRPENAGAIRQLLTETKMATVCTFQAAGVVSRELIDCFVGRVGLFKNQPGDTLLDQADVILTVGYDSVEYDPEIWNAKRNKTIIHLDYHPANIHSCYNPPVEILGNIAANIYALTTELDKQLNEQQRSSIRILQQELFSKIEQGKSYQGKRIHPLRFIHDLHTLIDDEITIVSDIGTHYMWLARYFLSYRPHQLLFSNGQQTLGVALPFAMAACYARPDKKVISISGDGGFLFSAMELETAVREKLHIVHCVWCDGTYNMVQQQQLLKYQRDTAVHFGAIDLVKFAESFGARGFQIQDAEQFKPILQEALNLEGPVIIEIPIDYSDNAALFASIRPEIGH